MKIYFRIRGNEEFEYLGLHGETYQDYKLEDSHRLGSLATKGVTNYKREILTNLISWLNMHCTEFDLYYASLISNHPLYVKHMTGSLAVDIPDHNEAMLFRLAWL